MADEILSNIIEFDPDAEFNYNKFYIGLKFNGRSKNYSIFRPKKNFLAVEIKLPQTEENDEIINQAEITTLDYDKRYGNYRHEDYLPKKHKSTAYCKPVYISDKTETLY